MERIVLPGDGTEIEGLRFVPAGESRGVAILLIHENRGTVPYMVAVATDLADHGYDVVMPDLLSRVGGTDAYADAPNSVTTRQIAEDVHDADLVAVYDWMTGRWEDIEVVGLCFGAEMGWRLITKRSPERAALLYGVGPAADLVPRITTRVHAVYAQHDPRVNDTLGPLCAALVGSDADVVLESYPGTKHAFHDHDRPDRYHPEAARAMWRRVLDFLG